MKKILTMLLALVMTFALNSCGDAGPSPAHSSTSASTSITETEPHKYTVYDLDGLITGIGDVAVIKGSTVDLLALVSYDGTVITDVALDTGLLDFDSECQVTVTYTITADTAALAQHLGLEIEEGAEQSLSFEVAKRVYVIAESGVAEFQEKHPEVPVYTNNNVLYAPAEIPQAEVTAAPEEPAADTNNSASDNQNQTANKPASNNGDTNSTSNNDSSNSNSNQGASNTGAGNNKPSGTDTTNTNNGSNHSNPGLNGSSGSNSGNGSTGTGAGSSGGNSGSSGNNTGNTGAGSSGNNTGNTGTGSSGNSGSGTASKPTHTHSYSSKVTKAATCSTPGTRTYTCSCGDTYTESIPATGNHTWIEVTTTVNHEESGHWETKTISEAWDEDIRETKAVCNYGGCGAYYDTVDEVWYHILDAHDGNASYSAKKVTTGTIHHDAVTEDVWVVDQAAYTETVVTGYKCSVCGATK